MKSIDEPRDASRYDAVPMLRSPLELQACVMLNNLAQFIKTLPLELYRSSFSQISQSSVGKHIRHSLDHFDSFRSGLESGVIDYDQRPRDEATELHLEIALSRVFQIQTWVAQSSFLPSRAIKVRAMTDFSSSNRNVALITSSVERELHFVTSHLTHHMGIIRILVELGGGKVEQDFGKAVSTVAYDRERGSE